MLQSSVSGLFYSSHPFWARFALGFCLALPQLASPLSAIAQLRAQQRAQQHTGESTLTVLVSADKPQPSLSELEDLLERRGDLTLRNSTIEGALFTISEIWNVNIVVGRDVEGSVSCDFKQSPLKEILDSILLANGYGYRRVGDSLVVQPTEQIGNANQLFQSETIHISHGNLNEIIEGAKLLISSEGQVLALESARTILVIDFPDRVAKVASFVARMERAAAEATGGVSAATFNRLQAAYFHTQYIPVESTKEPISTVLSREGRVATMPAENHLVVVDYAANIDMVRKLLSRIDRPRTQIRITGLIYDISLQDVEQLGLNWNSIGKGSDLDTTGNAQQAITFDTQTLSPFTTGSAGGTLTVKSLTRNFDLNSVGLFLQNANDARLLADPNVTVVENETAIWKSVTEIPFQQITQSELGGQLGTTAFKEVGITLKVNANVAADGTVEMLVQPEFSRVTGFTESDNQPIIDTRSASTVVRIANRQTLVIGGLRQRSDTGEFNGIPFLKDLRFVGPLFRSRDTNVRESELVVFIMPEIISYDAAAPYRQHLAQETVTCRLDRVPIAEGCGTFGCASEYSQAPYTSELIALPPVDQGAVSRTSKGKVGKRGKGKKGITAQAILMQEEPFRRGFQERYRAKGEGDNSQQ